MNIILKTVFAASALIAMIPAGAETVYRCFDAAGNTIYSDLPCSSLSDAEQLNIRPNTVDTSGAREQRLKREIEALRNKNAALERERPVTGRTPADLQAERSDSFACTEAKRAYEKEASLPTRRDNKDVLEARRVAMYSACGMREPDRTEVNQESSTTINSGRRLIAPASGSNR